MVEIRAALMDDIEAMVELGKAGHVTSKNAHFKFDDMGAKLLAAQCIVDKRKCAFVATVDGQVVGVILGIEDKYPYLKMTFATDLVVYATAPGAGRRLLERFTSWALDERRVDQVLMGVTNGHTKATTALYKRLGFAQVGGMFTKEHA